MDLFRLWWFTNAQLSHPHPDCRVRMYARIRMSSRVWGFGLVWFECEGWLIRKFSDSYSSIRGTPSRVLLCRVVCLQKLHVPVPLIFKSGSLCLVLWTPDSSCSVISVWMKNLVQTPRMEFRLVGPCPCHEWFSGRFLICASVDFLVGFLYSIYSIYSIHYANSNSQLLTSQLYINSSRQ